jgi:hypothetical protein
VPSDPSNWTNLIDGSEYSSDDQDMGVIEAVSRNFIVVKKGLVNIHRYYIPLHRVEGCDGKVVWLKTAEEAVKRDYERDVAPDPYNYHYSSAPTVDPLNVISRFQINMPKIPPRALDERPFVVSQESSGREESVSLCNLCNASFKTDDELSLHVESNQ